MLDNVLMSFEAYPVVPEYNIELDYFEAAYPVEDVHSRKKDNQVYHMQMVLAEPLMPLIKIHNLA